MKALKPTVKNKIILSVIVNIFMFLIYLVFISDDYSLKQFGSTNLIILMICLNWLPKSINEMDEREKIEYLKIGNSLWTISTIISTTIFILHVAYFHEMTVIQFFLSSAGLTFIFVCMKNLLFQKELKG
jgi:hypothetical protein